jgi:hypothetical protein
VLKERIIIRRSAVRVRPPLPTHQALLSPSKFCSLGHRSFSLVRPTTFDEAEPTRWPNDRDQQGVLEPAQKKSKP